ncbi:MAG: hypothetical protein Q7K13_02450 [Polynucleobacter sp.]|uniref:hypothetical protein n=1 Tax=Polynucleobacter sp. TaxID=2029855 RepID=UPI00271C0F2E|nr:hypothetical protein [Polynucleobacter sp.]MDO8713325.1 hypothetical protein [Polynucleobacter sp.]
MTKRATRSSTKAARFAANATEKAITRLGRWAITDHTGTAKLLANLLPMGFIDTLITVAVTVLCSLLGAAVSAALFFLLIAYGIPLLLSL